MAEQQNVQPPRDITSLDLSRGWYMSTDKKNGTPGHWVMTTFRGMTTWGDCEKMKMANADPIPTYKDGRTVYIDYRGTPTCTAPKWVSDFKEHHPGDFQDWIGGVGLTPGQYWEVNKGRVMLIGGITAGVLILIVGTVVIAVKSKEKKGKTVIKRKKKPEVQQKKPEVQQFGTARMRFEEGFEEQTGHKKPSVHMYLPYREDALKRAKKEFSRRSTERKRQISHDLVERGYTPGSVEYSAILPTRQAGELIDKEEEVGEGARKFAEGYKEIEDTKATNPI